VRNAASYLSVFVVLAAICSAQTTSTISLSNGVQVQISNKMGKPTGQQTIGVEMLRASGNSFYRIFRDQNKLTVFAYELMLNLSASGDRLTATAKPVETEFASRFPNADGGKPVPTLSSDQSTRTLASGQSADIGLFELEGMGLKVIDTIRLKMDDDPAAASGRIRFSDLKVTANRSPLAKSAQSAVSGKYAMFYIPGQGGFFFSIEAVAGKPFVPAGTIDKNHMTFTVDNQNYDVVAAAPILTNPDTGELWVYHDPAFKPEGNWTQNLRSGTPGTSADADFFMAASDSLSWWLEK
jgi:hypothetical protein